MADNEAAYADTDTEDDPEEDKKRSMSKKKKSNVPKLFRLSSRIVSLKRRGEQNTLLKLK